MPEGLGRTSSEPVGDWAAAIRARLLEGMHASSKLSLQQRLLSIVDSSSKFGADVLGMDEVFRKQVISCVDEVVLNHFRQQLPTLNRAARLDREVQDPIYREPKQLNKTVYFLPGNLTIREWMREAGPDSLGISGVGLYTALEIKDDKRRLVERIVAQNGELCTWERFRYDEAGNVGTYVETHLHNRVSEARVLQFVNERMTEDRRVIYFEKSHGNIQLTKRAKLKGHKGGWATIDYDPSEDPARAKEIGWSSEAPSARNNYEAERRISAHGVDFKETSGGYGKVRSGSWTKRVFEGRNSRIVLTKQGNGITFTGPDGSKASFPSEISKEAFDKEILDRGFYK